MTADPVGTDAPSRNAVGTPKKPVVPAALSTVPSVPTKRGTKRGRAWGKDCQWGEWQKESFGTPLVGTPKNAFFQPPIQRLRVFLLGLGTAPNSAFGRVS
jgi:hypothetical protein